MSVCELLALLSRQSAVPTRAEGATIEMLKSDYNRAVALCKASIDGGFDLTTSHTTAEGLPFDATHSLRRQMFSRWEEHERESRRVGRG